MAQHPYYPLGLELPGFVPQLLGFDFILGVFFAGFAALFLGTWMVSGRCKVQPELQQHRARSPADEAVAASQAASRCRPRSGSSPAGSCAPA
jgi:hypothetical protein